MAFHATEYEFKFALNIIIAYLPCSFETVKFFASLKAKLKSKN